MGVRGWWNSLTSAVRSRSAPGSSSSAGGVLAATSGNGWEAEAIRMYDLVPELRYGISWIASSASRASLIVAKVPDHPAAAPIPVDEESTPAQPLYDLAPTAPDQSVLIHRMITLLKLVGKWRLIGFDDPLQGGKRRWLVLSDREYVQVGNEIRLRHPDTGHEMRLPKLSQDVREGAWVITMWNPHPIQSYIPDSPVRALIDTLHELVDLSGHVQTAARSRLAGKGILLMPSSLKPVAPGQSTGVNPPKGNPAMRALTRTAQASFRNPQDISRHLPVIFEGNQEALNAVRHVTLDTPFDDRVDSLRTAAIRRIAIGLDIPPEVLSGMGELNHWTAWQVDASGQKINVAPTLAFICRELTTKYLVPSLRAMGVNNAEDYMVWYDDTALESTPNKDEVAIAAYDIGLIGADAARGTLGYGPADAPPPGSVPPSMQTGLTRVNGFGARGMASTEQTQIGLPAAGSDGWLACADVAARRALGRAGQYLLGAGGRSLRGKYRDTPIHDMHTKISPANHENAHSALRGAFAELAEVEPALVKPVMAYALDRLTTRQSHNVSVLTKYLNSKGEPHAGND